jgi:ribonucleoside-diphosphate reductase alpha chain
VNEQRTKVFLDRYAMRDENGQPVESTPSEMWSRVARAISSDEREFDEFNHLLQDWKFVPGGRILSGAGTESEVTFYNCYVIPVETKVRRASREYPVQADVLPPRMYSDPGNDSREAIFDTIGLMVDIMSRGGGVGINWSVLRPKGAHLKRVNGTTSGPVSWMDVASRAVGVVEQGGSRRGAAMFMLDDWHPDVEDFINAKRDFSLITNANVSVAVSDEFMEAVRSDGEWHLRFPDTSDPRYNSHWSGNLARWESEGGNVVTYRTVRARDLWRSLAAAAWGSGEPGVVFLGRYNLLSTGNGVEDIISVNPCGEQGLGAYSVCNLGSMNLDAYIKVGWQTKYHKTFVFDWDSFSKDIEVAVRFLDNVIDKNFYFIPENEAAQKNLRRIGLGVMGLADALIALGLTYGEPDAVAFTEKVFELMKTHAIRASNSLAKSKGPAPAWKPEMASKPYFRGIAGTPLGVQVQKYGMRNLFLLTQAPTGTTSILAGVNSGIEPYFAFKYTRKDRTGEHIVHASAVEKYVLEGASTPKHLVTSGDVSVEGHIAMQAAAQKYIDSSVSKTINGPNKHTVDDVERAYTLAYDSGLKGLAYFRDGSGRAQVLYKEEPKEEVDPETGATYQSLYEDALVVIDDLRKVLDDNYSLFEYAQEYKRPELLNGTTVKTGTRAGTAYITVNSDPDTGRAVEVFFNVGKAGSDVASMAEAMGRLASLALRKGAMLGGVANQLEGVGGSAKFNKPIPHAIGEALTKANKLQRGNKVTIVATHSDSNTYEIDEDPVWFAPDSVAPTAGLTVEADLCPECGTASFVREEGCAKCLTCGHSVC